MDQQVFRLNYPGSTQLGKMNHMSEVESNKRNNVLGLLIKVTLTFGCDIRKSCNELSISE